MHENYKHTLLSRSESLNQESYQRWIDDFDWLDVRDRRNAQQLIEENGPWPLISVVMPAYKTKPRFLHAAIESVRQQVYPNWELCIVDDASSWWRMRRVLTRFQRIDERIKVTFLKQNCNISVASNHALEMAAGDWVAMLDHDDVISPHALLMIAIEVKRHPDTNLLYSDSDNLDKDGQRCSPYFKPDWNYDLLLAQNYFNHLTVFRRSELLQCGGFRQGFEGSQDYDALLRFIEGIDPVTIRHIPHILYHWRIVPTSVSRANLAEANRRARVAIQEHLDRRGETAQAQASPEINIFHSVLRRLPNPPPRVSVIAMFTRDHARASEWTEQLESATDYPNCEFLTTGIDRRTGTLSGIRSVAGNQTVHPLEASCARPHANPISSLLAEASGEVLVFVDHDVMPITTDWLQPLVEHALRGEIGMVQAKVLDASGKVDYSLPTLNEGLLTLGGADEAEVANSDIKQHGYVGRWVLDHQVPAITGGCYAVRRSVLEDAGGFDASLCHPKSLALDLSQEVSQLGLGLVWSSQAQFQRRDLLDAGLPDPTEINYLVEKWGSTLEDELEENPNLIVNSAGPQLIFPPHEKYPWRESEKWVTT